MQLFVAILLTAVLTVFGLGGESACANFRKELEISPNIIQTVCTQKQIPLVSDETAQHRKRIYGRVLYVSDGDTLMFQPANGEKFKIRLYGIDTPEKAQPYGPQATGILKRLVLNEIVNVDLISVDHYGRQIARIYVGKQDINAEMIRLGAAWHYKFYDKSSNYQQYEDLERYARQNRLGLWNRPNPTPPWEYRRAMRVQRKE